MSCWLGSLLGRFFVTTAWSMALSRLAGGGDDLLLWKVAVNTFRKQPWIADSRWSSSLGVGQENHKGKKISLLWSQLADSSYLHCPHATHIRKQRTTFLAGYCFQHNKSVCAMSPLNYTLEMTDYNLDRNTGYHDWRFRFLPQSLQINVRALA